MRNALIAIFFGLNLFAVLGASAETAQIGIVDYEKISKALVYRDLLQTKMNTALAASRKDIEALTKSMQEKQNQLDKKTQLTDTQKNSLKESIEKEKKQIADLNSAAEKKALEIRETFSKNLRQKLEESIGAAAKKHNLSIVYTNIAIAYSASKVDVTDEVITAMAKNLGVQLAPASQ